MSSPRSEIRDHGFSFVSAAVMRDLLEAAGSLADWDAFAASWHALEPDTYMADGGRYRRRRHAVYRVAKGGGAVREAHQPHFQTVEFNTLNGGVDRWFAPVTEATGNSAALGAILAFCEGCFGPLAPEVAQWRAEVHQFRIEAKDGMEGKPTPEGMHRDGVDYVLVLMVARANIASGTTTIVDIAKQPLGSFTLATPLDAALVDDRRVFHGVTPVVPLDPAQPAFRDVLVVTFRKAA